MRRRRRRSYHDERMTEHQPPLDAAGVASLAENAIGRITAATDRDALEQLRVHYLGRQGEITALAKTLGSVPAAVRPAFGQAVNTAKKRVQDAIAERQAALGDTARRPKNAIDITLPGLRRGVGRRHPLMQTMEEVKNVLVGHGVSL